MLAVIIGGWVVLWPSLDAWAPAPAALKEGFTRRISPGLDIQGGLRLQYEVEVEEAIADRTDRLAEQVLARLGVAMGIIEEDKATVASRESLQKTRERVVIERVGDKEIVATFPKAEDAELLTREMINEFFPDLRRTGRSGGKVTLLMKDESIERLRDTAVQQVKKTVQNRINELEVRDMAVDTRENDLIVEVPGASEEMFDRVRTIISRTAQLSFNIENTSSNYIASLTELPAGVTRASERVPDGEGKPLAIVPYLYAEGDGSRKVLEDYVATLTPEPGSQVFVGPIKRGQPEPGESVSEAWRTYTVYSGTEVTGEDLEDANFGRDPQSREPLVAFTMSSRGAGAMGRMTGSNIKRRMMVVLDDVVESAATIQSRIARNGQITLGGYGQEAVDNAKELEVVLRAGALPAPIRPANEQLIGPTLGHDAVQQGAIGGAIGVGLVLLFMLLYYQVAGFVADLMVVANIMLVLAALAFLEATLTLPGVAGIALTVGMAVDANVLTTERIREELRLGKAPRSAVEQGYRQAFSSIFDAQITTFIAGVVLFQYGTGPIKGFAVTLMIGIATSLFTGVFCSKVVMDWIVKGLRVKRLPVG